MDSFVWLRVCDILTFISCSGRRSSRQDSRPEFLDASHDRSRARNHRRTDGAARSRRCRCWRCCQRFGLCKVSTLWICNIWSIDKTTAQIKVVEKVNIDSELLFHLNRKSKFRFWTAISLEQKKFYKKCLRHEKMLLFSQKE